MPERSDHPGLADPGAQPVGEPAADAQSTGPIWRVGGRYRVTGRIGSGGMADVFRAQDELLQRDVALKVFRTAVGAADTAAGVERQRAELHALVRLNHPHLITLYDGSIVDTDGPAYLVMELIEGPTLADRIADGPLPEAEVRVVGAQVADALAYVHASGMVHRDVKPANILLGTGGIADLTPMRARLSDFGIVRLLGAERLTSVDATLGTASYLAPEQARGSAVGPAADVYALGLTLIEALTGDRSFDGPTPLEAVIARLDRDPVIPQHLPPPWPGLLAAMTARDPDARPSSTQVAHALRSASDTTTQFLPPGTGDGTALLAAAAPLLPQSAPVVFPPPRGQPGRRGFPAGWIVAAGIAVAIIAIGLVFLLTTHSNDGTPAHASTSPTSKPSRSTSASKKPSTRRATSPTNQPTTRQPSRTRTSGPSSSAPPRTSSPPRTSQSRTSPAPSTARSTPTSPSPSQTSPTTSAPPAAASTSP